MLSLSIGDIITEFKGQAVYSMDGLREQMAYTPAGTEVTITLYRLDENDEFQMMTVTVVLGNISSYSI